MRNIHLALFALFPLLLLKQPGALHAQSSKVVIAVETESLNYLYTFDDRTKFIADIRAWFPEDEYLFVEAVPGQTADYLLRIRYKKDPPGGYKNVGFLTASTTVKYEADPAFKQYPQQETTPQERAQAAATRSPGTVLVPYSEPILNRPGNNLPLVSQIQLQAMGMGMPMIYAAEYSRLHFILYDARSKQVIWSQKRKTNKFIDIYTPLMQALAVELYTR